MPAISPSNMRAGVLNLNTTQKDLTDLIKKVYGENGTDAQRQELTKLLGDRANILTGLTNIYKLLADTARAIIQNMR